MDVLRGDLFPAGRQAQQLCHGVLGLEHMIRLAANFQVFIPTYDAYAIFRLQQADIFVKRAEEVDHLFQPLDADILFNHFHPPSFPGLSQILPLIRPFFLCIPPSAQPGRRAGYTDS